MVVSMVWVTGSDVCSGWVGGGAGGRWRRECSGRETDPSARRHGSRMSDAVDPRQGARCELHLRGGLPAEDRKGESQDSDDSTHGESTGE